ncbi:MAG: serine hydrolase [Patescibacteria group bacterium]|jgi:beta-lactamase class A
MNKIFNQGKISSSVLWLIIFILGILAGRSLGIIFEKSALSQNEVNSDNVHPVRQSGYKFINPLLECEIEMSDKTNLFSFKNHILDFIEEKVDKKEIVSVSVYLRDLNNGPWSGINEKENFYPASLLKVPILMAYFKEAEKNPQLLEEKIVFNEHTEGDDLIQNFNPAEKVVFGQSYSVSDLLRRMIVFSDNKALDLLFLKIDSAALDRCYQDLGLSLPNIRTADDFMSVKEYASFFRILYNASYLSRDYSEKALEILSASDFKDGIVAGVDKDVKVAHKFGERKILIGGQEFNQLHDCGIVYNQASPYLLCIMTRGSNFEKMVEAIKNISRIVFEDMKNKQN